MSSSSSKSSQVFTNCPLTVTLNSSVFPARDYNLRVTVANELGEAYSEPVPLTVAAIPKCSITSSSIIDYTYPVYDDDGNEITNPTETTTVKALTALPLTVTLTGNGDLNLVSGTTQFNDTANSNDVYLASGADFDGYIWRC